MGTAPLTTEPGSAGDALKLLVEGCPAIATSSHIGGSLANRSWSAARHPAASSIAVPGHRRVR